MLGYVILGIVILFILLLYISYVVAFIFYSKRYKNAIRINATIKEDLGELKMVVSHRSGGIPRYRRFEIYKVSFWLNGVEYIEEAELRNRTLKIGEVTEVRYDMMEGKLKMVSEAYYAWIKEMAIGWTIGLIFGGALGVYKLFFA